MGNPFRIEGLDVSPGMSVRRTAEGAYELALSEPIGSGTMRGYALSPYAFAATVDFTCERCPSIAPEGTHNPRWFSEGTWFLGNLCLEGRCEVEIPDASFAVVAAGDFCVSCSNELPQEYRYPLGRYRGVEIFVNTRLAEDPTFALLKERSPTIEGIAAAAGFAAVFPKDGQLNGCMERIGAALCPFDAPQAKYELLGLLMTLQQRDLSAARPRLMLTRGQMRMARAAHDQLEGALDSPHDARDIAARLGVSAATLNGYFTRVYGQTIAEHLRRLRMEHAAELLQRGTTVADAAVQVGYANPSKFAAAFKRAFGATPREWLRQGGAMAQAHGGDRGRNDGDGRGFNGGCGRGCGGKELV